MIIKLVKNADHFSNEHLRLSYIANRLEDIFADRALIRFNSRSLNSYKIAQNVFNYLLLIYEDFYRVVITKIKF